MMLSTAAPALAEDADFNQYILAAIKDLYPKYARGGYDMGKVYTHDIDYGTPKAFPRPLRCPLLLRRCASPP
jgi:hypothetical protein